MILGGTRRRKRWLMALLLATVLTLGLMGYLKLAEEILSSEDFTLTIGSVKLSLYKILKGGVALVFLLWAASEVSETGEKYLRRLKHLRASNLALIVKAFQIAVYFIAFLLALDILGINLTSLAFLSGAIGIGIGFGLQKITSNFISGLILLFEKSVEEGDLIELTDGTMGFVRQTGARFTRIETFDSKEIMIPNEDFITSRVTNWTFSHNKGRVDIYVSVAYDSDSDKAHALILQAAREHPRCSRVTPPQCYLLEFGESALKFLLYFWVDDVIEGRYEPQSDVMRSILKKFKENDITIPYPRRDVHVHNAVVEAAL
ncbi:MAG: mechanosensitive ion channel [Alphaproteobacteria bacterium]|nr:mechanosensitive ion channel [Alphaproteobacteria bacterium]